MPEQKKPDMYFREAAEDGKTALDIYYKIKEISTIDVNITEVNKDGIIIYDTRISRKAVENKFNYLKMIQIEEEDFNKKIIEKLNEKESK